MKKFLFTAGILGMLIGGIQSPLAAQPCCPTPSCCENWSIGDGKFTVGADWLYWNTTHDNLDFAILSTPTDSGNIYNHVKHPKFNYESGFRVNLGYELPCDSWDVGVIYTYIPSHAKRHLHSDATVGSSLIMDDLLALDFPITSAKIKWRMDLSYLDIDLGRTISFGECFHLRPHVGARILWIDKKLHIRGRTTESASESESFFRVKDKFDGYGIEGGMWADWNVGCGLSIVGHVGGSVLYSKNRIHTRSLLTTDTAEHFRNHHWSGTPTFDYFIGLQYADCFCETAYAAKIGWEQHVFLDVNHFARGGNISTQGLTLGLDVSF